MGYDAHLFPLTIFLAITVNRFICLPGGCLHLYLRGPSHQIQQIVWSVILWTHIFLKIKCETINEKEYIWTLYDLSLRGILEQFGKTFNCIIMAFIKKEINCKGTLIIFWLFYQNVYFRVFWTKLQYGEFYDNFMTYTVTYF